MTHATGRTALAARLAQYGARLRTIDGRKTVEMREPTDGTIYQYRRQADGIERRRLLPDGRPFRDGSPWEGMSREEIAVLRHTRGDYHPILDPLGL